MLSKLHGDADYFTAFDGNKKVSVIFERLSPAIHIVSQSGCKYIHISFPGIEIFVINVIYIKQQTIKLRTIFYIL